VVVPWEEWFELQVADVANCHIAVLPLHPDLRAKFNVTAAWEYARRMSGLPYGYHNMIFSWIDTPTDNYPPPLDSNLVFSHTSFGENKVKQVTYCGGEWKCLIYFLLACFYMLGI